MQTILSVIGHETWLWSITITAVLTVLATSSNKNPYGSGSLEQYSIATILLKCEPKFLQHCKTKILKTLLSRLSQHVYTLLLQTFYNCNFLTATFTVWALSSVSFNRSIFVKLKMHIRLCSQRHQYCHYGDLNTIT